MDTWNPISGYLLQPYVRFGNFLGWKRIEIFEYNSIGNLVELIECHLQSFSTHLTRCFYGWAKKKLSPFLLEYFCELPTSFWRMLSARASTATSTSEKRWRQTCRTSPSSSSSSSSSSEELNSVKQVLPNNQFDTNLQSERTELSKGRIYISQLIYCQNQNKNFIKSGSKKDFKV